MAALNRLCVTASKTVPQQAAKIKGKKYQSNPSEWSPDAKTAGKGFSCLKFSVESPQYFIYRYTTSTTNVAHSGNVNTTFDAIAQGDLDADGKLSEIKMSGKVVQAGKGKGRRRAELRRDEPDRVSLRGPDSPPPC